MARGSCSSVDTRSRQLTSPSTRSDGMQSVASELGPDCLAGTRPTLFWRTTADGSGAPQRLSADPAAVFSDEPAFSPDGRRIVFASNRGGAPNIWAMPVGGGPPVRLTSGPGPDESPTVDRQ